MSTWEEELRVYFPTYLLPSAQVEALPPEAAQLFLARLTGRPDALHLLLAASALAPVAREVRELARELGAVSRELPSRTEVERVVRDGSVRGRLDAAATAQQRIGGHPARVVSRASRTSFALPENELLVAVAERVVALLRRLEAGGVISRTTEKSWARGLTDARRRAEEVLRESPLARIPRLPHADLDAFHVAAARAARPAAYGLALRLHEALCGMSRHDPAALALLVAEGALAPVEPEKRFEIAVLIRLGRCLEAALVARGFTMERAIIEPRRREVFAFHRGGTRVNLYYNQVILPHACICETGLAHYLGGHQGLRPDFTLEVERDGVRARAVIADAKLSENVDYLKEGYLKILRYRADLAAHLDGWPTAILIASSHALVVGAPRQEDPVIAVPWKDWVPPAIVEALVTDL